jgi:hypothetical protein
MSVAWMWGWELGAETLAYQQTGWGFAGASGTSEMNDTNPFQPASGFGGGRYNFRGTQQRFNQGAPVATPSSGKNSIGVHSEFIFHTAYKREGVTGYDYNNSFLRFNSGVTVEVELAHTLDGAGSAPIELRVNGVLLATTTTVYTSSQPYHRVVLDMDGPNGNYDIYINGVLEISVSGSVETFPSISVVEFLGGSNASFVSGQGGHHDHCVLWDAGNHSTNELSLATIPTDTNTVTVGGQTYTFKTALTLSTSPNEVLIGASAALSRENLINAINLGPGAGTLYGSDTTLNAVVTALEDLASVGILVTAKLKGVETGACSETLAAGGDVWASPNLGGGDDVKTNDLALALGQIFIQGLLPNRDDSDGNWLNVNGLNDGTNVDLFNNVNDGTNLTDFIETTTLGDAHDFQHEVRGSISGSAATGTLTASAVADGDTVTIGSQTYTFRAPFADVADNINAAGTLAQSMENLRRAINGDGVAGTNYGTGTTVNVDVSAIDSPTTVAVTALLPGSAGNSISTTEGGLNTAWATPTLVGGTENWVPSEVHAVQSVQIARGSGAISGGRGTIEIPSLGKLTGANAPVSAAGQLHNTLRLWGSGNVTTDIDGIKSGFEV